ncbi:hypothetical protein [Rhizobium sp. WL3]|uniref:hypothetical protein n=1 Tax=Rhizobium sp. WL3 TaxID=2603277 RepID=UPI001FED896C|nr:hypothetical protein [Rhizobium sp. WL3]
MGAGDGACRQVFRAVKEAGGFLECEALEVPGVSFDNIQDHLFQACRLHCVDIDLAPVAGVILEQIPVLLPRQKRRQFRTQPPVKMAA